MGRWPHCKNGHGPLESEKEDGEVVRWYCPECEYELSKEWVERQRMRYPEVK